MPTIVPLDLPAAYWRDKAQRARRAGNLSEALRLFRAALRKHDDLAIRRELAEVYADMRSFSISNRLYLENLARDAQDADSLFGLARNHSLMGDENTMADLLDLYLRMAPCGAQADSARDILWRLPRPGKDAPRQRRAHTLYFQALDRMSDQQTALQYARRAWKRGKLPETAQLLSELYLRAGKAKQAMKYALYACENMPEEMNARLLLGSAMHVCGMPNGCHAALSQAMPLCKTGDQAAVFCRQALLLGCGDLAVQLMEKRAEEAPCSAETLLLLALTLRSVGGNETRVQKLLNTVITLDEEDPLSKALLEVQPLADDTDETESVRLFEHLSAQMHMDEAAASDPEIMHRELIRLLRLPLPGIREVTVRMMMQLGDERGLRMALVQEDMPSPLCAVILSALEKMQSPMPCFAKVEGKICLLPPRIRPPYDADLHDLIRKLLREVKDEVPLSVIMQEVPRGWRLLPESARKHYAQSRDDVWLCAFAAYVRLCAGNFNAAEERIDKSSRPLRTGRAYMQLIRRTRKAYEVH